MQIENQDAAAARLLAPIMDQLAALQRQMTTVTGPHRPSPVEVVTVVESPVAAESSFRRPSGLQQGPVQVLLDHLRTGGAGLGPLRRKRGAGEPRRRSRVGTRFPQGRLGSVRKRQKLTRLADRSDP